MNNNLTENLRHWRVQRNITNADTKVFVLNILEELLEIYYEDKEEINDLKYEIWLNYFKSMDNFMDDLEPISEANTIDAIQDIQVFGANETELMGYDNLKCNDEVFKEINSRKQCPEQFIEWNRNGAKGKWMKWSEQPDSELYKADYSICIKE